MKLREIFRFELAYQARRPWPWLAFVILVVFSFQNTRVGIVPVTLPQDFVLNSPFIIAAVTVISSLMWLLVASAISGEAGARDVQTGMHPLTYTLPVSKSEYLGGRLLAAFTLNALILLGVQVGSLLAAYAPGVDPEIIGRFRPTAYLAAYTFIALPNVLIATAMQFSLSLVSGRALASYLGSMILVFLSVPVSILITFVLAQPTLGKMTDPLGFIAIMNAMMLEWTIVEKNVRMFMLEGPMIWNRLLWLCIAFMVLGVLQLRFRFAHRAAFDVRALLPRRFAAKTAAVDHDAPARVAIPRVRQSFGLAMRLRQTISIAWATFRAIAKSPAGLFLLAVFPMFVGLVLVVESEHWGVPLLLRTANVLADITSPLTHVSDFRAIIPLLIVYFVGELVWRERDARISENVDATSVPEWVLFLGKFLGLGLVLAAAMTVLAAAGMFAQVLRGYYDLEIGLYLRALFGLQLPEYLLFAVLAFLIHAVVNHKHVGLLVALTAYFLIIFAPRLGIEHNLLIYTAGPEWSFTEMRGFGSSLGPWLWFKMYWAAWALLLAVMARVVWTRGEESGLRQRLRIARGRCTRETVGVAVMAVGLILGLGGFVFYNTNVLNEYRATAESVERLAEYERRYGRFEGIPQPHRTATKLHIEIYPVRGAATIRGSYVLVNHHAVAIDSVHLEPASGVATRITLSRAAAAIVEDHELGHSIYGLRAPLQPGDSLTLDFEIGIEPRGFRHSGPGTPVVPNGTHFTGGVLPAIGYQPARELTSAADRRAHGLPRQVTFPAPDDVNPELATGADATFEAVMGTHEDQVAVAPGELRRTWLDDGRRYFHYGSDVPIGGQYMFFSAEYAVHMEQWKGVEIQVYNDPRHTHTLDRLLRSARASLDYYSAEFGAYPFRFLQFIEQPANGMGMGVDGSGVITGLEGFFRLDPKGDDLDAVFQIVAHEMAHQWWGVQLGSAFAEGAIVLSESLAWYSALQVVKNANGADQLRRFMSFMRQPYPWPPIRTGLPLLRAMDPWAGYRKGPYALYALSEYVGEGRVNEALASLLRKKAGTGATTLDLYGELQAVTPDSLHHLLHDLFEVNTFWELDAERAGAERTPTGTWEVEIDVRARKIVADSAGVETEVPMDEWVQIGVFGAGEGGDELGVPLYLEMRRIRSGEQTIMVTVPSEPALAGIDPHHLLDWEERGNDDNIEAVTIGTSPAGSQGRLPPSGGGVANAGG